MTPTLTVVGATGVQGGSVIDSALKAGGYKVRAITRNASSDNAKALAARGVEVVRADLNDSASLVKAFEGSTAIFAVTNFFEPFAASGPEKALEVETTQGINLARAASQIPTLQHYIWSTLPNAKRISNGKYSVPHFDAKNVVDDYIKSDPVLLSKTTFLWVTFYASNYQFPVYTPNFMKSSGKHVQLQPTPASVPILAVGDARINVGVFTTSILAQPRLTLGKFVLAYVEKTTAGELLETWSTAVGKPVAYVQTTTLEAYNDVWPMWGLEIGLMMKFWEEEGEKSWSGEVILTKEDLGIQSGLVGSEQGFKNLDWSTVL